MQNLSDDLLQGFILPEWDASSLDGDAGLSDDHGLGLLKETSIEQVEEYKHHDQESPASLAKQMEQASRHPKKLWKL